METPREYFKRQAKNGLIFLRWCVFGAIIGVTVGAAGAGFHHALDWAGETRDHHWALLYLLPVVGIIIAFLYEKADLPLERGTNFILTSVRENHPVRLRMAPLIVVGTVLTHLCGGSAGREGAALQLGGSISGNIGHWMRLDDRDARTITMCGMAAGFTALFGTPLAAVVFAMEVISVGVMYYAALFPCVLSAMIARLVAARLGVFAKEYAIMGVPSGDAVDVAVLVRLTVLGVLCAVFAALVCILFHRIGGLLKRACPNRYLCIALGGVIVIALTLLLQTHDYNGAGMQVIERALLGQASPLAFFWKLLFTAVTIGVGYKGGEIVPVFFMGATFGCVAGGLLGLTPSFGAALGMVAVFCGVTNSPLTSMFLAYELFGGSGLPMYAYVIAIAYMLSGYYGLYSEQKIIYSKMRPQFIDRKTK